MPIFCSHCNEELFGAVNRCWKCGRHFSARPAAGDTPPVRRAPVAGPVLLVREERAAVILDDVGRPVLRAVVPAALALVMPDETPPIEAELLPETHIATLAEPPPAAFPAAPAGTEPHPAGSPFAAGWTDRGPGPALVEPEAPAAIGDFWSSSAASAALALGTIGLISAFLHWWPLTTSLLGLAAGIWGLRSPQAPLATVGLGLCSAAIALAEFQAAATLYEYYTGMHPFTV